MLSIAKPVHQPTIVLLVLKVTQLHNRVYVASTTATVIIQETVFLVWQEWHSIMEVVLLVMFRIVILAHQMITVKIVHHHINSVMEHVLRGMELTVVFQIVSAAHQTILVQYVSNFLQFSKIPVWLARCATALHVKKKIFVLSAPLDTFHNHQFVF